jgi:hypothetical protein
MSKRTLVNITDDQMAQWLTSLERINAEIQELWLDRHIWRGTRDIAAKSSAAVRGSFFVAWLGVQYYRRAAIAVRTMVDTDKRTDSFVNLLKSIEPHVMKLPGANTFEPGQVRRDMAALKKAARLITPYVNKHLAHVDRTPTPEIPEYAEIDDAVQLLGELLERYELLLKNVDFKVGPFFAFNWTSVFHEAWIEDARAPRQP